MLPSLHQLPRLSNKHILYRPETFSKIVGIHFLQTGIGIFRKKELLQIFFLIVILMWVDISESEVTQADSIKTKNNDNNDFQKLFLISFIYLFPFSVPILLYKKIRNDNN